MKPVLVKIISCPNCSKEIPEYEGEVNWCNHCDWNLIFQEKQNLNVFEKYHEKLGKKISQNLFETMIGRDSIKPRWGLTKIFTVLLCVAIVSTPLLMILVSYLAYIYLAKLIFAIVLILCLGVSYISLSVKKRLPENIIQRIEAPTLYTLVDKISEKIDNTKIAHLAINHEFNASYTELGVAQFKKRYISIGAPLADVLNSEELIALISHEISHGANGDIMRGSVMYRAKYILSELYFTFSPKHTREGTFTGDVFFLLVILGNYIGKFAGSIPLAFYKLVTWLSMRDSQESEYYADILAAQVCGKGAIVSMLAKLRHTDNFELAVSRASLSHGKLGFFDELRRLSNLEKSEHNIERFNRLEMHRGLSLNSTHPPANYRIKYIEAKAATATPLKVDHSEFVKIKAELSRFHEKVSAQIIDEHLSTLYR